MADEQDARQAEIVTFKKEIDLCYYTRGRAARLLNELTSEMQKWRINEQVALADITNV